MAKIDLTAARVRELLQYDQDTGVFRWKTTGPGRRNNLIAGNTQSGRRFIRIDREFYLQHRVIWLYIHGEWPKDQIDHINGNPLDNRIANLRDVDQSLNQQNKRKPNANNTSGYMGVSWHKKMKCWRATIVVNRKQKFIGNFSCPAEAGAAYLKAKRELHLSCTI